MWVFNFEGDKLDCPPKGFEVCLIGCAHRLGVVDHLSLRSLSRHEKRGKKRDLCESYFGWMLIHCDMVLVKRGFLVKRGWKGVLILHNKP